MHVWTHSTGPEGEREIERERERERARERLNQKLVASKSNRQGSK
jgi:hypothetical protein